MPIFSPISIILILVATYNGCSCTHHTRSNNDPDKENKSELKYHRLNGTTFMYYTYKVKLYLPGFKNNNI